MSSGVLGVKLNNKYILAGTKSRGGPENIGKAFLSYCQSYIKNSDNIEQYIKGDPFDGLLRLNSDITTIHGYVPKIHRQKMYHALSSIDSVLHNDMDDMFTYDTDIEYIFEKDYGYIINLDLHSLDLYQQNGVDSHIYEKVDRWSYNDHPMKLMGSIPFDILHFYTIDDMIKFYDKD